MARFSIPLCIATVSYWLLSGLTKIYIQNIVGDYANGLYAVSNKFATLITLFVSVIQFAWNESAYIMTDDSLEKRRENYATCINVMTLGVIYGIGIVCIAVKLIFPFLIDEQYSSALGLVPATIIGVAANALAGFSDTIFMAEKKNGFITISTLIASGINVVAGYFFTKAFGLHGAVISFGACLILLCVMRVIRLGIAYKLKLNLLSTFIGVLILTISIVLFFLLDSIWILLLSALLSISCLLIAFRKHILMFIHSYRSNHAKN
jgi:O-antigen/teichoic acid export membrane protein